MSQEKKLMSFGVVCIALLVGLMNRRSTANSSNQNEADTAKPTRIALIDMAQVFNQYLEFQSRQELLKTEIAAYEKLAVAMSEEVKTQQEKLKTLPGDSLAYAALQTKNQKLRAEFETFRQTTTQTVKQKESKLYGDIYTQISDEVEKYALTHHIDIVLRFEAAPSPDDEPGKLIQSLSRQVVYQRGLDITDVILETLNSKPTD